MVKHPALALVLCAALGGCAVSTTRVSLSAPSNAPAGRVIVTDARLDRQIMMQEVSYTSAMHLSPLQVDPEVTQVLARLIERETAASSVRVQLERIEVRNQVGFGKADQLACGIESDVSRGSGPAQRVRSSATAENSSPMRQAAAAAILDACLSQHANDIGQALR